MDNDKERLLDFLMDVNRLNLDADPDLHYTIYFLKGDKFMVTHDKEFRVTEDDPNWYREKEEYHYANNYKFDEDGNLTELFLASMKLSVIPDTIHNFKHLRKLFLANNGISHITEEITEVETLIDLNLNQNLIKHIPESIVNLKNLQKLQIANNYISSLPDGISSMPSLKELNIADNKIDSLPKSLLDTDIKIVK